MEIGTARVGRTMSRTVVNHVFPLFLSFLCSLIFPLYEWPVGHTVTRSIRQYIRSSYVGRELHRFVATWSSRQLEFYLFPLFEFQHLLQHDRSSFLSSSFPSRCCRGRTGHFISGRNFDLPTTSLGWSVLDSAYCLLGVKYPAAADSAQSLSWANKDSDPARKENDDNTTEPATGEIKDKAAVKKRKMRE